VVPLALFVGAALLAILSFDRDAWKKSI